MNAPAELTATMAPLLRHAWITGNSANVLRYLSRPLTAAGKLYASCPNEVMSRVLDFHDGLRVRHWVDHNRVKVVRAVEYPADIFHGRDEQYIGQEEDDPDHAVHQIENNPVFDGG